MPPYCHAQRLLRVDQDDQLLPPRHVSAVSDDAELQRTIGWNMQQVLEYRGADAIVNAAAADQASGGEVIDAKSEPVATEATPEPAGEGPSAP